MARNKLVDKTPNVEAGSVEFKFEDGTAETFEISRVPDGVKALLALHGASQKIGDSYAGSADEADPLAFAKEMVRDSIARLYAGDWRAAVAGRGGILAEAFASVTGKTPDEVAEILGAMSDDEKKDLRKKPKIAAMLARIKLTRDAARVARLEEAAAKSEEV